MRYLAGRVVAVVAQAAVRVAAMVHHLAGRAVVRAPPRAAVRYS